MRFGSPRSDCLRLVPYICSKLLEIAPDCSRFTEKMLPDMRVMQISPRSTPAEFGKKTIGAFRVKKSSVMKAKLGRQKKSNQEKRVQSQSIPRHQKDSSIDSDAGHTASNPPSPNTRWNCNFTQRCTTERPFTDCLKGGTGLKSDFLKRPASNKA